MQHRIARFIASLLACLVMTGTAQAHTYVSHARLWAAMDQYSTCRHVGGGLPDYHTSGANMLGGVSFETTYRDGAGLVVLAGGYGHRAEWITRHGVVQVLFHFRRLRQVAGVLEQIAGAPRARCS